MYKVILILDHFILKCEGDPHPQEKLPSKSPALLALRFWGVFEAYFLNKNFPLKIKHVLHYANLSGVSIVDFEQVPAGFK